ncbi:C-methyltransferase [Sulfuricella denitrificans skB26]|uniref:C-methyltransferase n=1 Tax=Sulfuricella denitrificans (strain DSM 22764 / NBRC 105220 / skB26) TaxID=1163617 RepID=S6B4D3_SULDS|nr:class I SAM-dependent methyltransferase [Sulfuricella denitrificans]BAN35477.1 C-methyltransferase [Sulfuricella denitrificans skB26]
MKCRHCQTELTLPFIDLGAAPPSNAYLTSQTLHAPEKYFPLRVLVCTECWLVQTEDYAGADELFSADYAYFSSFSTTWLNHAEEYVADMVQRFGLNGNSRIVEVAANDGYLLQYVKARNIPCLGVEPTAGTAGAARKKGIEIVKAFFGVRLARDLVGQGKQADLTVANNVLAHVPDINDFVAGFSLLLKPAGVSTFEFPHLLRLVSENQFDTIYHEHYSYLSLTTVKRIFEHNGLSVFDVEELPTHGGSLRVYAQRSDSGVRKQSPNVAAISAYEAAAGMIDKAFYAGFQTKADHIKNDFLAFLIDAKRANKAVAGYGAAAKGNTLLNYAGVRSDLLPYVVDRNPAKQDKFLPGCRIPIVAEAHLQQTQPDYVAILPWNLREEVMAQLAYIREWGGQFVTSVPVLEIK